MTVVKRGGVVVIEGVKPPAMAATPATSAPSRPRSDHADGVALAAYLVAQHRRISAEVGADPDLADLGRTMREVWGQVDWRNAAAAAGLDGPVSTAMQCVAVAQLDAAAGAVAPGGARSALSAARSALRGGA